MNGDVKTWIKTKLAENNYDKKKVYEQYDLFCRETESTAGVGSYERHVRVLYNEIVDGGELPDFDSETVIKGEANRQNLLDKNNHIRKLNRESFRVFNLQEAKQESLEELFKKVNFLKMDIKEHKEKGEQTGIITFSDFHFNELIEKIESNGNEYNFVIASKRLKKFVSEAIKFLKLCNVKNVYLFMLGDMINSNRRMSEQYAQIMSLTSASILATQIIQQAIIELSKHFNINVSCVVGNESRLMQPFMDSSNFLTTENWDYSIFNHLKLLFKGQKVNFIVPKYYIENLVQFPNGFNALLLHGHLLKGNGASDKEIAMTLQKYIMRGIPIHGVFTGHRHNSSIGDIISRSSSLCGGNSYSAHDLGFMSRASQNVYVVNPDLSYNGFKIDLQNVDNVKEGYYVQEELERYFIPDRSGNIVISKNLA